MTTWQEQALLEPMRGATDEEQAAASMADEDEE